jgi:hypothetical protein
MLPLSTRQSPPCPPQQSLLRCPPAQAPRCPRMHAGRYLAVAIQSPAVILSFSQCLPLFCELAMLPTEPHPLLPHLVCSVFFPNTTRTTAAASRCNSPSPHRPVPIPCTSRLPTLSSCSSARAPSTPTAPRPEFRSPRAAARRSRLSSVLPSTASLAWPLTRPGRQTVPR